nr:hypothetical protein [Alloacidobacterium dinghuense]
MQQGLAVRRKLHQHFTMIVVPRPTSYGALVNKTIYKFYSTVMANAELLRKCGNRGTSALGQALECQEKLMLMGFDTLGTGRFLAKAQELPDAMPKLSKLAKACF